MAPGHERVSNVHDHEDLEPDRVDSESSTPSRLRERLVWYLSLTSNMLYDGGEAVCHVPRISHGLNCAHSPRCLSRRRAGGM